jgi:predicted transcriptional regulator
MARINWLDEETHLPALDAHVQQLEHFTRSLADGVVDNQELATQVAHLVTAMKAVQDDLSDEQHAKVTTLLVELTATNVMQTLHELAASRARSAVR